MKVVARLLCLLWWVAWAPSVLAQTPNLTRGMTLYNQTCASCHGPDPRVNSTAGVANNPAGLLLATQTIAQMGFLRTLLTTQDRIDVTAWIGSIVNPQGGGLAHESGWYWNPAEGGRGYFFEKKSTGSVFMAGFLYAADGRALWFTAQGSMSGNRFEAPMNTFTGGQTLTGPYITPAIGPILGTVTLDFSATNAARLTMPGTDIQLVRFPFASGSVQAPPQTGAPESGWYWNAAEGGRGYAIEFQANQVFIIAFMYDAAGNPIWYLANGTMASPTRFVGAWSQFANGQALGQPYRAPSQINANAGALTIQFSDAANATLTLPDGRNIGIVRFPF